MQSSSSDDNSNEDDEHDETAPQNASSSLIPEGLLPGYLAVAFQELYEQDGLAVLAKGLGWLTLMASFCRFYADVEEGHYAILHEEDGNEPTATAFGRQQVQPPLVLVLGLRDREQESLLALLDSWGTPHRMMPTVITNESGQGKDRAGKYCN